MKSRNIFSRIISCILILSALYLLLSSCQFRLEDVNLNEYQLSNKICNSVFGIDSDIFVKTKGANTLLANGYTYATVTADKTLILKLTDAQLTSWKNNIFLQILQKIMGEEKNIVSQIIPPTDSIYGTFYENADIKCGFEISDDYSKIIAGPGDDKSYALIVPQACLLMQVLEGVPSDKISVEYFEVNSNGVATTHISLPKYTYMFQNLEECKQLKSYEQIPAQIVEYLDPTIDKNYNDLNYKFFWGMKYQSENLEYEIFAYEFTSKDYALKYYVNVTEDDTSDYITWIEIFSDNQYEFVVIENDKVYVIKSSSLYIDSINKMLSDTFSVKF